MEKLPNIEKSKIEILKENLREIFDISKYSTFGHGTGEAQAKNILKNGLESAGGELQGSTLCLDNTDNTDESLNKILNWPHHNYKHIVIVMVPNVPVEMIGKTGGYHYFDNVFEKLPENRRRDPGAGSECRKEYYIQPQFIKGYIDVNSLSLVKNELYDPEAKVAIKETPQIFLGRREYLRSSGLSEEDIDKLMKPQESNEEWG